VTAAAGNGAKKLRIGKKVRDFTVSERREKWQKALSGNDLLLMPTSGPQAAYLGGVVKIETVASGNSGESATVRRAVVGFGGRLVFYIRKCMTGQGKGAG